MINFDEYKKNLVVDCFADTLSITAKSEYSEMDDCHEVFSSDNHEISLNLNELADLYEILNLVSGNLTKDLCYDFVCSDGNLSIRVGNYYENPNYEYELETEYDEDEIELYSEFERDDYIEKTAFIVTLSNKKDSIELWLERNEIKGLFSEIEKYACQIFNKSNVTVRGFLKMMNIKRDVKIKESNSSCYEKTDVKIIYLDLMQTVIRNQWFIVLSRKAAELYLSKEYSIMDLIVRIDPEHGIGIVAPSSHKVIDTIRISDL